MQQTDLINDKNLILNTHQKKWAFTNHTYS